MENGYMLKTHKMSLKLLTARKTFNKIALPDAQSWENGYSAARFAKRYLWIWFFSYFKIPQDFRLFLKKTFYSVFSST